jgi:multidrug efflux pump subunit AcrA (membrane-fusion protein)
MHTSNAPWLLLPIVGLVACGGNAPAPAEKPSAPPGPPTIDVVRVVQQATNVALEMPGQLDPYESVAVYPKVTGFVKSIRVDRGSRVRMGELMAELEAPEVAAQRAEAQSSRRRSRPTRARSLQRSRRPRPPGRRCSRSPRSKATCG